MRALENKSLFFGDEALGFILLQWGVQVGWMCENEMVGCNEEKRMIGGNG